MKNLLSLLAPCATVAIVLSGCGTQSESTNSAPSGDGTTNSSSGLPEEGAATNSSSTATEGGAGGKELKLAFITNNASDYWTVARKGVEKADDELTNVTVDFQMPGDGTAAEQTRIIDNMLSTGVKGMAISPVDPKNQKGTINKAAKQALVITQDSDAVDSDRTCYIGTDNVAAGRQAGELLKKALPNGGNVMAFVGKRDSQNAADRLKGVEEAIKGSKVKILDVRTDDTDRAKAKSNVSDALVKYPDLAGCVGLYSYNGPAILSAVKDAGKLGKVKIIAFDEEDDTLAGIKAGNIEATVVQQPFEFGYRSIINMNKIINGDKSLVIPAGKQIFVPTKGIDKTTVDAFAADLKKLRGK